MAIRVYEFSKKYKLTNKDVLAMLEKGGFAAKSHMSVIPDQALKYLEGALKKPDKPKEESTKKAEKAVLSREPIKEQKKVMQTQPAKSKPTRRSTPTPKKTFTRPPKRKVAEPVIKEKPSTIALRAMTVDEVADQL